jgi:hypothetical protein
MKTKLTLLALFVASAAAASAAVLNATTAVHTKPDESSPAITFFKAGTEPTVAKDSIATTPAGWLAVELPGPFECYVQNKDLTKNEDPKPGSNLYLRPKLDSGVITTFEPGDKAHITGIPPGRWTQMSLDKKLIAYIHIGSAPGYLPTIATEPAAPAPATSPAPVPVAPPPAASTAAAPVTPPPIVSEPGTASLPRLFAGKFVSTRSPFHPRRPFDWALNDENGSRFAYLDISKLVLTDQIENYTDHTVVVYGAAHPVPGGKEIVISVDSLQLK